VASRKTPKEPTADLARLQQKVLADWGLEELPDPATAAAQAATQLVQRVFDALCIAQAPRGKTWVMHFMRAIGWRAPGKTRAITAEEIAQALLQLRDDGRVRLDENQGWQALPEAWAARWPELRRQPEAKEFWKHWIWATGGGYGQPGTGLRWASIRSDADAVALARLVLAAHPTPEEFNHLSASVMSSAGSMRALLAALTEPFDPAFLAELPSALLWGLLNALAEHQDGALLTHPGLLAWLDGIADRDAKASLPQGLRLSLAERRLHRGDLAGMRSLLKPVALQIRMVFDAAALARDGHWAGAASAFADSMKALATAEGRRKGLLPFSLQQWQVWALLAQAEPAAWAAARKLAVAESGSRNPSPHNRWGRFAHAAAVRLGDTALEPSTFEAPQRRYGNTLREEDAETVILAAWLGHPAKGWHAPTLTLLTQLLHRLGQPWKADLLGQACARLGWPVPPRPDDAPPPWTPTWFGAPTEPWQDALAAIAALDGARGPAGDVVAPLHWRLTLDRQGRPHNLEPFERAVGPRSAGKLKAVSPAALKRRTRLDVHDAAVARCLRSAPWDGRTLVLDLAGATAALVGHPDLALDDAPTQPVQLVEGQPTVSWERGRDGFRLRVEENLLDDPAPDLEHHHIVGDGEAERTRRNAVRVVRDAAGHARLLRVDPAHRRVAELAAKAWAVPLAAEAELERTLQVLARHFTLHSDAGGGREVASESRLVAQLAPRGGALQLRIGVRPFGSFGPLLLPGAGRARLVTPQGNESLVAQRDLEAERSHFAALNEALPFLGEADATGRWLIDEPELALAAVEALGSLPAIATLEWPQGQPLRVLAPPEGAMTLKVSSGRDWFALDGTLKVDEDRVLTLRELLALWRQGDGGRYLPLSNGAYLALSERLRQQLADLQALGDDSDDGLRLPAAAAAWLAQAGDAATGPGGDATWRRRLARLTEAADLEPAVPAGLQATLRPYQGDGFAWLARLAHAGFGAVLADDMGLGKTLQTLALLLQRSATGPALVVAPTSVVANWAAEAERFAPALRTLTYAETDRAATLKDLADGDLMLVSYGLLLRDAEAFGGRRWGTLVLDEAQALKNAATQRAKAVAELESDFRLALTGTPVENRLADLWSLMNLLNPGLLGNERRFAERFGNPIERQKDGAARQRLRRLVGPFLLRRTKAQVLAELPPRTESVWRVEPDADEKALLEALRREAQDRIAAANGPQRAFQVLTELTRLRRAACDPRLVVSALDRPGAKVRAFGRLMADLAEGGHRCLVFSQFTDFLDLLGQALDGAGLSHLRLDGSTPAATRANRVAAFQRGEGQSFLISLKAGGFGLNLTAADYVVIADPWWNPAAEDQATGRAHRIGQARPVTVYRLVTAGSIEERIVALHGEKRALADGLLEGQDGAAPLDAEALLALLKN
jgi:superfamily II DNA or RNA helicase